MELSGYLRKIRIEKALTMKEVADKIEVHHSLLSAYETGRRRPAIGNLKKLATLYKLPYLELLKMRTLQEGSDEYLTQKKLVAAERKIEKYEDSLLMIRVLTKRDGTIKEIRDITNDVLFGE